MLTIHSGINQNYQLNPAFCKRNNASHRREQDERNMSEIDKLKAQYEEEREEWVEQKQTFEEMIRDKEANLPKPLKTTMKGGAVLAACVLGGMATGYSARYIMDAFKKMYKTKQIQSLVKGIKNHISTPIANGFKAVKKFASNQLAKLKKTDSYKNSTAKLEKKYNAFKDSKFAQTLNSYGQKIADNKYVKKFTGAIDTVFSGIGNGVVNVYNKLAKVNYKNAAADTLGVAGGISTGAVTLMDEVKKPKDNDNDDTQERYIEEEI
ncbi:hypothetical protein DBY21_05805 [Candidatus Gastranaerophilales bacterium]|nr:MAG: hypothetical protein DBY21_05805 [Candidatus Gastranaerophilales bacterium]